MMLHADIKHEASSAVVGSLICGLMMLNAG